MINVGVLNFTERCRYVKSLKTHDSGNITFQSISLPVTMHALRHTHASQLIDAGVDVVTISKQLGHASPAITLQVYAHLFQQRDSKAVDAIERALRTLGIA